MELIIVFFTAVVIFLMIDVCINPYDHKSYRGILAAISMVAAVGCLVYVLVTRY